MIFMKKIIIYLFCLYYILFVFVFPHILHSFVEGLFSVSICQKADYYLILLMFVNSLAVGLVIYHNILRQSHAVMSAIIILALSCLVTEYSVRRAGCLLYRPSVSAIWELNPNYKLFNKYGMNYHDFDAERVPGEFRFMVLGDSTAWGYEVNGFSYSSSNRRFSDILEKKLRKKYDRDIKVLNAAVPGYSSLQALEAAKKSKFLQPDCFIISTNSDWIEESRTDKKVIETQRLVFLKNILYKFDSYLYLRTHLFESIPAVFRNNSDLFSCNTSTSNNYPVARVSAEDTFKNLSAIMSMAKSNIPAIIMDMPLNLQATPKIGGITYKLSDLENYRNAAAKAAASCNGVLLSIDSDWDKRFGKRKPIFFMDNVHTNETGHKILADDLFKAIEQNEIVK